VACGAIHRGRSRSASIDHATAGGTDHLAGTPVFENFVSDGTNHWTGEAFVPDIGHRFASHIVLVDHDHAPVAGCLLCLFLCQSQIWQRR